MSKEKENTIVALNVETGVYHEWTEKGGFPVGTCKEFGVTFEVIEFDTVHIMEPMDGYFEVCEKNNNLYYLKEMVPEMINVTYFYELFPGQRGHEIGIPCKMDRTMDLKLIMDNWEKVKEQRSIKQETICVHVNINLDWEVL